MLEILNLHGRHCRAISKAILPGCYFPAYYLNYIGNDHPGIIINLLTRTPFVSGLVYEFYSKIEQADLTYLTTLDMTALI